MEIKANIMDDTAVARALKRVSHEIIERNDSLENVVLIGIKSRGIPLAGIIAENVKKYEGVSLDVGELDISLYRDDLAEKLVLNKEDGTKPPKTVNPGDTVRIVSLDKKATVLSKPDSKGEVQVQAGVMKLNAKLADLRMMQDDTPQKGVGKIRLEKDRQVGMELDIRGMLVDDAILVVDRYIDNAVLSGLTEINIIHGKGTGALRAGIQDYLRTNKRVKSFRLGNYGEGDAGVTVVTLKDTKQ